MSRSKYVVFKVVEENPIVTAIYVILILGIIFGIGSCCARQEEQALLTQSTINLADLVMLTGNGSKIDLTTEKSWLSTNAPDLRFTWGDEDCHSLTDQQPYDGFCKFHPKVTSYMVDPSSHGYASANRAAWLKRNLNAQYKTLHFTIMLEQDDVNDWLTDAALSSSVPSEIQGYCYFFIDDQMVYQSPVLTIPNASLQYSLDVTGAKELVVVVVGAAHLTDAYLTR